MTQLSPRQQDVADCIAQGMSYADVAKTLGIARATVKAHVHAIAGKIPNPSHLPQRTLVLLQWKKTG